MKNKELSIKFYDCMIRMSATGLFFKEVEII
jgi:hypothetical protein